MKKLQLVLIVLSLITIFGASSAIAASTATLTVNANVLGTCNFATAGTILDFGAVDPTLATPATATTTINYTCTNGLPYSFVNPTAGTMLNGVSTLNYNLAYADSGVATGSGTAQTLTIDGTLPITEYPSAIVGAYTGSVILDIIF